MYACLHLCIDNDINLLFSYTFANHYTPTVRVLSLRSSLYLGLVTELWLSWFVVCFCYSPVCCEHMACHAFPSSPVLVRHTSCFWFSCHSQGLRCLSCFPPQGRFVCIFKFILPLKVPALESSLHLYSIHDTNYRSTGRNVSI